MKERGKEVREKRKGRGGENKRKEELAHLVSIRVRMEATVGPDPR